MVGRTYLLAGERVVVVCAYNARMKGRPPCPSWLHWERPPKGGPRNVMLRYEDGRTVVRPFRGCTRPPEPAEGPLTLF